MSEILLPEKQIAQPGTVPLTLNLGCDDKGNVVIQMVEGAATRVITMPADEAIKHATGILSCAIKAKEKPKLLVVG